MCGRYDNLIPRDAYSALFRAVRVPRSNFPPRYNVAPTDQIPIIRVHPRDGERELTVTKIAPSRNQFSVVCADGFTLTARKILLTTGLTDEVPQLEGIERLYGRSVLHCPYCDGFEHRDQPIAVYGVGHKGASLALMMKQWSSD